MRRLMLEALVNVIWWDAVMLPVCLCGSYHLENKNGDVIANMDAKTQMY